MKKTTLAALATAAALGLTGCVPGLTDLADPTPSPPPAVTATPAPPLEPTEEEESTEAPPPVEEDVELAFGDTARWDDGVEVKVGKPKKFKPSEYAVYPEDVETYYRFEVTVKNDTGSTFDPSSFYTTASTGGEEAEEVFDSEKDLDGAPSTKVRAGKTVSFDIGFGVNSGEFVLEVNPDFDHDSVLFIGTVK